MSASDTAPANAPGTMLTGSYLGVGDIRAKEKPIPFPQPGELLVKVARAGICGTDMHTWQFGGHTPEGMTIGHEFSGEVAAVGPGLSGLEVGQRVTINPMHSYLGLMRDGAFAQYVIVPEAQVGESVFLLPDAVDFDQAALVEPLAVALRGVNRSSLCTESNVLLQGLGTIGLCVLLIALQRGAKNIVAVDRPGARLDLASRLGVKVVPLGDHSLDDTLKATFGEVEGMFGGPKVDLVIDATGNPEALTGAINRVAPGGEILVLGTYATLVTFDMTMFVAKELTLSSSVAYEEEFPAALALIDRGEIDVMPLISHSFPLREIDKAFERQADSEVAIKVFLVPNGP